MSPLQFLAKRVLPSWLADRRACASPLCTCVARPAAMLGRSREWIRLNNAWYCGPVCCQAGLQSEFEKVRHPSPPHYRHRIPLGLALLAQDRISHQALQQAMALHRATPSRPIGACLAAIGAVDETTIASALAAQWGVPAFLAELSLLSFPVLPRPLVECYQAAPVHWHSESRSLLLGFSTVVNHSAISAIERILSCRIQSCIVRTSAFHAWNFLHSRPSQALQFSAGLRPNEIAATVMSYVSRTGANEVRFARTAEFAWARLADGEPLDLLFPTRA